MPSSEDQARSDAQFIAEQATKIVRLERDVARYRELVKDRNIKIKEKAEEVVKLQANLENLKGALERKHTHFQTVQSEVYTLRRELEDAKLRLTAGGAVRSTMLATEQVLKQRASASEVALSQVQHDLAATREHVEDLSVRLEAVTEERDQLKAIHKNLEQAVGKYRNEKIINEQAFSRITGVLETRKAELKP